ncbi:MAG: hypothetical protein LBH66_05140 [Oscillospiraceae bacterium]|jgi:hypothetical protein|nr:hypothetical protein [Oscillospiraceae bacterium]
MRLRGDEERRLLRRVQRYGDRDAAEALIQKYYDEIYAFIRRQTNCADIARDIAAGVAAGLISITVVDYALSDGNIAFYYTRGLIELPEIWLCGLFTLAGIIVPTVVAMREKRIDIR